MKTKFMLSSLALIVLVAARPVPNGPEVIRREVPQEHSHEIFIFKVRDALRLNNPAGIGDPVFGLLGNKAGAEGLGQIADIECLQQATADQAFTNAKAGGDVGAMTAALVYRALERNTAKVGQASNLCTSIKAVNFEIAAISQHQDPASPGAAATNKAVVLELAKQIASVGGDPLEALKSGTFKPGDLNDASGKGNTCDDLNDPQGCIFTQNLLVEDATPEEISAAVGGFGNGNDPAAAIGSPGDANSGAPVVVGFAAGDSSANASTASDSAMADAPGIGNPSTADASNDAAPASDSALAAGPVTADSDIADIPPMEIGNTYSEIGAEPVMEDLSDAPTYAMGYSGPPAVSSAGESTECPAVDSAPFADVGMMDAPPSPKSQYVSPATAAAAIAISLAADIIVPSAASAASSSAAKLPTPTSMVSSSAVMTAAPTLIASPSPAAMPTPSGAPVTAPEGLDFGSCPNAGIVFGPGFDDRKEDSFQPADTTQFQHGSAQNIAIITDFMCDRFADRCGANEAANKACIAASAAAVGKTGQAAATAWNNALGLTNVPNLTGE